MTWAPWSPAWTRKHLLGHIVCDDWVVYRDECDEHGNLTRRWFAVVSFGPEKLFFPVLSQTILTASPGSQQTITSDATWNNSNNTVESIGGGGSGATDTKATARCCGGGGGCYSKISNFSFATHGTTTAGYEIGSGGAAVTVTASGVVSGNAG